MTIERTDPEPATDERTTLLQFLDYYRDTLLLKADGLTDEQARDAAVPPSDLNLMGLVRHMAEVERSWFRRWFLDDGAPPIYYGDDDPDGDLHPGPNDTLAEAVATYSAEIEAARAVVAGAPDLDAVAPHRSERHPGWHPNLRWILVHMIEETARHAGHADLLRQRIDGAVGD